MRIVAAVGLGSGILVGACAGRLVPADLYESARAEARHYRGLYVAATRQSERGAESCRAREADLLRQLDELRDELGLERMAAKEARERAAAEKAAKEQADLDAAKARWDRENRTDWSWARGSKASRPSSGSRKPHCSRGKPCGNTCIARSKTCRK